MLNVVCVYAYACVCGGERVVGVVGCVCNAWVSLYVYMCQCVAVGYCCPDSLRLPAQPEAEITDEQLKLFEAHRKRLEGAHKDIPQVR